MKIALPFLLLSLLLPVTASAEWGYWHAPQVFILQSSPQETHVVQLGPSPTRGTKSAMQCQAIAFYKNGEAIKSYSRMDIFKMTPSLDAPAQHYNILGPAHGFRMSGKLLLFDVEDYKGDILTFDVENGERIKP